MAFAHGLTGIASALLEEILIPGPCLRDGADARWWTGSGTLAHCKVAICRVSPHALTTANAKRPNSRPSYGLNLPLVEFFSQLPPVTLCGPVPHSKHDDVVNDAAGCAVAGRSRKVYRRCDKLKMVTSLENL